MLFAAQYVKASRLRTTASACSVEASGIVKLAPLNVGSQVELTRDEF